MALDINIIVSESSSMEDANSVVGSTETPASDKDKNQAKKKNDAAKNQNLIVAKYAFDVVKSTIKQTANYFISDIGRSTGDSNLQQVINTKIEKAGEVLSIGGGAIAGAKLGATAGPVGAIIGTVIGVAAAGINLAFKDKEKQRQYEHEMFKENTSQAYNIARANYSALAGRLR